MKYEVKVLGSAQYEILNTVDNVVVKTSTSVFGTAVYTTQTLCFVDRDVASDFAAALNLGAAQPPTPAA